MANIKKQTSVKSGGDKPESATIHPVDADKKPFVGKNIVFMAASILLIVVGFILMAGDGSSVEQGFNPDIFSTRRIVVGPTLAFLGFLAMAFAIIYSPKKKQNIKTEETNNA